MKFVSLGLLMGISVFALAGEPSTMSWPCPTRYVASDCELFYGGKLRALNCGVVPKTLNCDYQLSAGGGDAGQIYKVTCSARAEYCTQMPVSGVCPEGTSSVKSKGLGDLRLCKTSSKIRSPKGPTRSSINRAEKAD